MVVHVFAVLGETRHGDDLLAFLHRADDRTCTTMRDDDIGFAHLLGELVTVKELLERVMFRLIVTVSALCEYRFRDGAVRNQFVHCLQQSVELEFL